MVLLRGARDRRDSSEIRRQHCCCCCCWQGNHRTAQTASLLRLALFLHLAAATVAAGAVRAESPATPFPATLVFTDDTESHASPCQSSPSHLGEGGLARRATALAGIRQ